MRLLCKLRVLLAVARPGLRRAVVDQPIERGERRDTRKGKPCAFEGHVAQMEPHPPWLGDLLNLVEIARGTVPVAHATAESRAGEEAAREIIQLAGGSQAFDGFA